MASNYTKLDLKAFRLRLTEGHYTNATGARRGVGKSEMTEDEKKKAYKAINEHFGDTSATAAEAQKEPAKRVAKTTAKTAAKPVAKAGAKRTAGRAKRGAKAGSTRGNKPAAEVAPAASQELADLRIGAQATRDSLAGLASASELDPGLDVKLAVQRGAKVLQHSIDRIGELLGITSEVVELPEGEALNEAPSSDGAGAEEDE
jgi:hypothetical protein